MALRGRESGNDYPPLKRFRLGQMDTYEVLAKDFNRIEDEARSIGTNLAFALASIPVAITLHVTLKMVTITDQSVKQPFTLLMYTCYILGAYFSVQAFPQRGRLKRFMQQIRDSQVPPLGEKGNELSPNELQQMQSEEVAGAGEEKR